MFDIGPSGGGFPDWLKQKTGGNTGITGGMRKRPAGYSMQRSPMTGQPLMNRPQVMPRRPMMGQPMRGQRPSGEKPFGMGPMPFSGGEPVSSTMPVGRQRPDIIPMSSSGMPPGMGGGMMQQPGQQPMEENQLWRTYNRLLSSPMAPRMLL